MKNIIMCAFLFSYIYGGEYPKFSSKKNIDTMLSTALKYNKKVKYIWGGTSLKKGIDCSAFVQLIFKPYKKIPRTTNSQIKSKNAKNIPNIKWLKKGDLIYFKYNAYEKHKKVDHVGIYIGNNRYIHSSRSLRGVNISTLDKKSKKNIMRILRIQI